MVYENKINEQLQNLFNEYYVGEIPKEELLDVVEFHIKTNELQIVKMVLNKITEKCDETLIDDFRGHHLRFMYYLKLFINSSNNRIYLNTSIYHLKLCIECCDDHNRKMELTNQLKLLKELY